MDRMKKVMVNTQVSLLAAGSDTTTDATGILFFACVFAFGAAFFAGFFAVGISLPRSNALPRLLSSQHLAQQL